MGEFVVGIPNNQVSVAGSETISGKLFPDFVNASPRIRRHKDTATWKHGYYNKIAKS